MPLPSTQDLDARFAVFLNPIRDLTKNWEVDIAKYLEEYLEEMSEVQISFDGGETLMNFAEAAMLIQGSATVYSKKVEFLWKVVLQMLDLLSSKSMNHNVTDEGTQEGANKSRRNKTNTIDMTSDFRRMNDISQGKNMTMKEDDEQDDNGRKKHFSFLPATPLHLVDKEGEKGSNRVNIYTVTKENFGGKDDFRLNRSYMTPSGLLCLDLPSELLKNTGNVVTDLPEHFLETPIEHIIEAELLGTLSPPPSSSSRPPSPPHFEDFPMELDLDDPPITEAPLENDLKEENVKNREDAQEGFDSPIEVKRHGLRTRAAPNSIIVPIKLTDPWKPMDPHEQTSPVRPVRAGRIRRPLPCACHKVQEPRKRKKGHAEPEKIARIDQHILKHLPDVANNNMKGIRMDLDPPLREEIAEEDNKRSELLQRRGRACDLLADGVAQSMDEAVMIQQQREQQLDIINPIPVNDEDNNDGDNDDRGDEDRDDDDDDDVVDRGAAEFEMPDPHMGLLEYQGDDGRNRRIQRVNDECVNMNDTLEYEPDGDYEALVQKWVAVYIVNAQDHIASSELTTRVNRWNSKITPVLALEEERQSFDIHAYGSKILDAFTEVGQELPFATVVSDINRKEVARLFLSSLMLANTYNVKPLVSDPGDSAMDCLSLRLLTRVRQHEEMQEYVAPSQNVVARRSPALDNRIKGKKASGKSSTTKRPITPTSSEYSSSSEDEEAYVPHSRRAGPLPSDGVNGILEGMALTPVCVDVTQHKKTHNQRHQQKPPKKPRNIVTSIR